MTQIIDMHYTNYVFIAITGLLTLFVLLGSIYLCIVSRYEQRIKVLAVFLLISSCCGVILQLIAHSITITFNLGPYGGIIMFLKLLGVILTYIPIVLNSWRLYFYHMFNKMELKIATKKYKLDSNMNEFNSTPNIAILDSANLDEPVDVPKVGPSLKEHENVKEEGEDVEEEEGEGERDRSLHTVESEQEEAKPNATSPQDNSLSPQKIDVAIPKVPIFQSKPTAALQSDVSDQGSSTTGGKKITPPLFHSTGQDSPPKPMQRPTVAPFLLSEPGTTTALNQQNETLNANNNYTLHMYTPQNKVVNPPPTTIPPFSLSSTTNQNYKEEYPEIEDNHMQRSMDQSYSVQNFPASKSRYINKEKSPSPFSFYVENPAPVLPLKNEVYIPDFKAEDACDEPSQKQQHNSGIVETMDTLQSQENSAYDSSFIATRRRHLVNKRRADESNLIGVLFFIMLFSLIVLVPSCIFQFWSLPLRYILFFQMDSFPYEIPIIMSIVLEQLYYTVIVVLLCIFVFYVRKLNDVYKLYIQLKVTIFVLIIEYILILTMNILMTIHTTALYGLMGNLIMNFLFGFFHITIQMGIPIFFSVPLLYESWSYRHKSKVDEHRSHYQYQIHKVNMLLNDHPKGVILLLEHATRLLCMDEMLFIIEIHQFKRIRYYRLEKAYHIIRNFVESNSTHLISFPSSIREQVMGDYRESDHLNTNPNMFDKMVRFVLRRMSSRNIFSKLFTSSSYNAYLSQQRHHMGLDVDS